MNDFQKELSNFVLSSALLVLTTIGSRAALAGSVLLEGNEAQAKCVATERPGLTVFFTKTGEDVEGRLIYRVEIMSGLDHAAETFLSVVGYPKVERADYSYTQYLDSSVNDPDNENQVRHALFQFTEYSSADSESYTATLETKNLFYSNQVDCQVLRK